MKEEKMCYVASMPGEVGYFAIALDLPEYKKDLAKDIAGWVKRGAIVERVTIAAGQKGFTEYCDEKVFYKSELEQMQSDKRELV
jgi:hypothetical protein